MAVASLQESGDNVYRLDTCARISSAIGCKNFTPAILEGATIYGADDEKVGKLDHLHGAGSTAKAVIDVGGFLGIGAKPVAVNVSDLDQGPAQGTS